MCFAPFRLTYLLAGIYEIDPWSDKTVTGMDDTRDCARYVPVLNMNRVAGSVETMNFANVALEIVA